MTTSAAAAAALLLLLAVLAPAIAQFTPQPGPPDFPANAPQPRVYPNFPQNAGGVTGAANPFVNQQVLPVAAPGWQTTGYTGGLTGGFVGQAYGGFDPVRGIVPEVYNSKGASSQGPTGRSGRGAASGGGFQNEDIREFRENLGSKEFIAPLNAAPQAAASILFVFVAIICSFLLY